VVVYWDQRYAGRSLDPFAPGPKSQKIDDYVSDLDAVISGVRNRLHCRKVVLVAHSWGTVPGLLYAEQHADNVAAYIGVGQEADTPESERRSYAWVLQQAHARGDSEAITRLTKMGPPGRNTGWTPRDLLQRYGGAFHTDLSIARLAFIGATSNEANWRDLAALLLAKDYNEAIEATEAKEVLDESHLKFRVPIFFVSGRYDHTVDADLAFQYLDHISAPRKAFIWFEHSGHYPPFEEPGRFNTVIIETILPIALRSQTDSMATSKYN
jgi:pimeloyl-ACP methyl ester carboxylesterase